MRPLHSRLYRAWVVGLVIAACTPGIAPTPGPTTPPPTPVFVSERSIPNTWAGLGLTGRLLIAQVNSGVWLLDLATGGISDAFVPGDPSQEWVQAAAAAPDGREAVIAYAPPPRNGEVQFGYTELWLIAVDGSLKPRPFIRRQDPRESYFTPSWTPDGKAVLYAHLTRTESASGEVAYGYQIERKTVDDGSTAVIVADAYWPGLSPQGDRLAYVAFSFEDATDSGLFVTATTGGQPLRLPAADIFSAVDAPLFVGAGSALLFSAPTQVGRVLNRPLPGLGPSLGLDLNPRPVQAHTVPSDWWRVELDRPEQAVQLTQIGQTGLLGSASPDGQWIAFGSDAGIYVMRTDGTQLTQLAPLGGSGSVDWIP